MLFPRVVAQAEKAWTKSKNLNYKNFLERLENEYKYLDSIDIYYYDFRENSRREEPQR
jgi:N-acetyl-beta-hexosaminidase